MKKNNLQYSVFVLAILFASYYRTTEGFSGYGSCLVAKSSFHIHTLGCTGTAASCPRRHTRITTRLSMNSNNSPNNLESSNRPSVRFSESSEADVTKTTSTLDAILVWIISDTGSIVLGCLGLILLLVGRLSFASASSSSDPSSFSSADATAALGEETRFNLLAALACCAVLVNGLSKLDVTTALAEVVQLIGVQLRQPVVMRKSGSSSKSSNEDDADTTIKDDEWEWLLQAALVATPAESAILLQPTTTAATTTQSSSWTIQGVGGVLASDLASTLQAQETPQPVILPESSTPILNRFLVQKSSSNNSNPSTAANAIASSTSIGETYLPTLQALPGRKEFAFYLPSNTQAVLLVPTTGGGVLALGANQARSFTPRDIAWCQAAAKRVG